MAGSRNIKVIWILCLRKLNNHSNFDVQLLLSAFNNEINIYTNEFHLVRFTQLHSCNHHISADVNCPSFVNLNQFAKRLWWTFSSLPFIHMIHVLAYYCINYNFTPKTSLNMLASYSMNLCYNIYSFPFSFICGFDKMIADVYLYISKHRSNRIQIL